MRIFHRHFVALALMVWLSVLAGCSGRSTYDVSGVVTYDGQPVEKGEISFVPTDGLAAPDAGLIEDGKFAFAATPGKKVVKIRGSRALPPERQTTPEMGLVYEDFIPQAYNDESTLSADVSPDVDLVYMFNLTTP